MISAGENVEALDAQFRRLNAVWQSVYDSVNPLRIQARLRIDSILLRETVAEAPTGVNAHYNFRQLKPGSYVLWAETEIGDNPYTWWAPILVNAGDSLKKDLDNSTELDSQLHCTSRVDPSLLKPSEKR